MTASRNHRTRRRALLGVAALLIAGPAWYVFGGAGEPLPVVRPVASASHELIWRPEDRRAWRLEVDSRVTLDPNGPARDVRYALHGSLCMRVLEVRDGRARVAWQLRDASYRYAGRADSGREAALGVPFLASFEGGLPVRFEFPAGLDGEIQQQLAEVIRTFQATQPDAGETRWTALEEHATGRYRAVYESTAEGWSRRKAAYLRGAAVTDLEERSGRRAREGGVSRVRVLESQGTLLPSSTGSWWERAEIADKLELSTEGNVVAVVRTRSLLTAADEAWDTGADIATTKRAERLLRVPVPSVAKVEKRPVEELPATPADRARFERLIAAFVADGGNDLGYVHALADLLRRFPELAAELPPMLASGDLAGTVGAGLVHALELAGNAPCQEALGVVSTGSTWPRARRIQAIIALGGVERPTSESVQLLWMLSEASVDETTEDLGHTALLALGRMGHTMHRAGTADYPGLAAGLQRALETTADPETRAVALKALANTRDGAFAPVTIDALGSAQPSVRTAAAEALAAMDVPESLPVLAERLDVEPDGRVRAALVMGMRSSSAADDSGLARCAALVEQERDPDARAAMACYLADNLSRYPQGRQTLERLLESESHPDILSYVAGRLYRQQESGPGR